MRESARSPACSVDTLKPTYRLRTRAPCSPVDALTFFLVYAAYQTPVEFARSPSAQTPAASTCLGRLGAFCINRNGLRCGPTIRRRKTAAIGHLGCAARD